MTPPVKPLVFIGSSGKRSDQAADAIHRLLGQLFGSEVELWTAKKDASAGRPWFEELAGALRRAEVGILCLTSENRGNRWLHFEAGALMERFERQRRVIPLLVDGKGAMPKDPLQLFQATLGNSEGIRGLVQAVARMVKREPSQEHLESGIKRLVDELSALNDERLRHSAARWVLMAASATLAVVALARHVTPKQIAPPALAPAALQPASLVVDLYTGTTGGAFDALGTALADRMNRLDGSRLEVKILESDGSLDNCKQLANQGAKSPRNLLALGPITSFVLAGDTGTCSQSVQVLAPLYEEVTHVIVRRAEYARLRQTLDKGDELFCHLLRETQKLAYVGRPQSGTRVAIDQVAQVCSKETTLEPSAQASTMSFQQAGDELRAGRLLLAAFGVPVGGELINELVVRKDLCVVSIDQRLLDSVQQVRGPRGKMATYASPGTYSEQLCEEGGTFRSRGSLVFLAGNARTSAEVVELALQALFDGNANDLQGIAPGIVTDPCAAIRPLAAHARKHPAALPALQKLCDRKHEPVEAAVGGAASTRKR